MKTIIVSIIVSDFNDQVVIIQYSMYSLHKTVKETFESVNEKRKKCRHQKKNGTNICKFISTDSEIT